MDNAETQPLLGDVPGPQADCEKGVSGHLGRSQPVQGSMATPSETKTTSGKPVGGMEPTTSNLMAMPPGPPKPDHRKIFQVKEEPGEGEEQYPDDPHLKGFPVRLADAGHTSCPESRPEDDGNFGKAHPKEVVEKGVDPRPNPCAKNFKIPKVVSVGVTGAIVKSSEVVDDTPAAVAQATYLSPAEQNNGCRRSGEDAEASGGEGESGNEEEEGVGSEEPKPKRRKRRPTAKCSAKAKSKPKAKAAAKAKCKSRAAKKAAAASPEDAQGKEAVPTPVVEKEDGSNSESKVTKKGKKADPETAVERPVKKAKLAAKPSRARSSGEAAGSSEVPVPKSKAARKSKKAAHEEENEELPANPKPSAGSSEVPVPKTRAPRKSKSKKAAHEEGEEEPPANPKPSGEVPVPKTRAPRKSKSKKAAHEEGEEVPPADPPCEVDPALIKKKKKHSILSTAYCCARARARAQGADENEAKKAGQAVSRSHKSINMLKSKIQK